MRDRYKMLNSIISTMIIEIIIVIYLNLCYNNLKLSSYRKIFNLIKNNKINNTIKLLTLLENIKKIESLNLVLILNNI